MIFGRSSEPLVSFVPRFSTWQWPLSVAPDRPNWRPTRTDASSYINGTWLSAAAAGPADGLGPTSAYSFSRKLVSSYTGAFYTTNTGVVDNLKDQSGNVRDLVQITAGFRPTPTTAGPNSIAAGDFDGSDDFLVTAAALSTFISNSAGYVIVSVLIDTVSANAGTVYQNDRIVDDTAVFMGLFAKNVSGTTPTFLNYNWDGTEDATNPGSAFSLATAYVLTWRHEGGTLYLSVNGGTEITVASGNTSTMTGNLRLGGGSPLPLNGKVFELVTFSTIPTAAQRTALIQNLGRYVGAAV